MSATEYLGVYSGVSAGTNVGTGLQKSKGKLKNKVEVTHQAEQDRHLFTKGALQDAKLNIAKIRVVSTIPDKRVDKRLREKAYVGFILTEVQETHNEKVELVPLPGDTYASYFYGASPRQFNFSGVLLNTDQDQWRDSFEQLYEEHLRGSASSRNFNIVQIRYGGRIVSGWLLNMSQQQSSQSDLYSQFSFSVLVSRIDMLNPKKDKYKDYLIKEAGAFDEADLSGDYSLLNADNYNKLINPVRTGTAVPPKRPRRGGKRRPNNGCYFTKLTGDGGASNLNGTETISDHISDSATCTTFAAQKNAEDKIRNITDQIEKERKSGKLTQTRLTELTTKQENMIQSLNRILNSSAVKEARKLEVEAFQTRAYNQANPNKPQATSIADLPIRKSQQKQFETGVWSNIEENSMDVVIGGEVVGRAYTGVSIDSKGNPVVETLVTTNYEDTQKRSADVQSGTIKKEDLQPEEQNNTAIQAAIGVDEAQKTVDKQVAAKKVAEANERVANANDKAKQGTVRQSKKPKTKG